MNFYIPEIGDHILLKKDWTFKLHSEHRNDAVAELNGYHRTCGILVNKAELPPFREPDYQIDYPDEKDFKDFWGKLKYQEYRDAQNKAIAENAGYQQYQKDSAEYREKAKKLGVDVIDVTLKKGTILAIDRIYIRKGASDYSSISFYIKNLPSIKGVKAKRPRFWAKLDECNNIEFEKTDKIK